MSLPREFYHVEGGNLNLDSSHYPQTGWLFMEEQ